MNIMQNIGTLNSRASAKAASNEVIAGSASPPTPWMQDFWLWILLLGPLVAPLFVMLKLSVLQPFAEAIYLLGATVCPKVNVHMDFLGAAVAVCYSCWASVWGLWTVRLLYGRAGEGYGIFSRLNLSSFWARWQGTSVEFKLGTLALGFVPWAADVVLWDLGVWASAQFYMIFAGYLGGLVAGMLVLPAASEMRARLERKKVG
ncbi:MAG: hypothetical protein IVW55_11470 [Chloroflexi bacterium]|nr:hypothetical protein [Chloroflexota bacterium]